MTVESVTYIGDLDSDNPAEGETATLHEGNDHIRNIKLALQNTLGTPDQAAYTLRGITTYTTGSGTYTVPDGVRALFVECVGGGGGAGGIVGATLGLGIVAGGGGGGYSCKLYTSLSATYAYEVGAGGAGGAAASNGSTGGNTIFGSMAAGGGGASTYVTCGASTSSQSALGAVSSGGDLNIRGEPSEYANTGVVGGVAIIYGFPRSGRASGPIGGSGISCVQDTNPGTAGLSYGGGGGGIYLTYGNTGSYTGGTGAAGVIRIWEYF
jgi:hypothetical protein